MVSRYFFGERIRDGGTAAARYRRYASRLMRFWLAWSAIHFVLPLPLLSGVSHGYLALKTAKWQSLAANPLQSMLQGGAVHLWFLISLTLALGIATICLKNRTVGLLVPIGATLYACGLLMEL